MAEVIDFAQAKRDRTPSREGKALCLNCKFCWEAVAPSATVSLQCPQCRTMQGVFMGLAHTPDHAQLQCLCGSFFFFADEIGAYCAHCGSRHDFSPPSTDAPPAA
jgi:Zn finger protein HypA/HybF involved in hydrogenase expression